MFLKTLKQRLGRPSKAALQRSPKRYVPIADHLLQDRIQSYLYAGRFSKTERIFPMARQTVNRHIDAQVERVGRREPDALVGQVLSEMRDSYEADCDLNGRDLAAEVLA